MKACVIHGAQQVLIEESPRPEPGAGQIRLRFAFGGVCGSDIHYFQHGRVGDSVVRGPMVLGHEFSAVVDLPGAGVDGFAPGDKVAVTPALPCGRCDYCRRGLSNLCTDMSFMGSAARFPHCDGGFASELVVEARQCIRLPQEADLRHVAMAEPYAVALHAVAMAGDLSGATVLVTGAGVIGQMCATAARAAGAARILMSDIAPPALQRARVFVDSYDTTLGHIGELKIPLETGAIAREDVLADYYMPETMTRGSDDEITLFKNGGGAHLDLMTSRYIHACWTGR